MSCPCECNSGGFCGGCGHAGCGGAGRPRPAGATPTANESRDEFAGLPEDMVAAILTDRLGFIVTQDDVLADRARRKESSDE